MSPPNEPADKSKPVLKVKNPHNYRKVGFSMIVISVSLVLIGLLVWSIGSNYHFSSNVMAGQELTAMTPKAGYQIVLFDYTQPVGAKLKLLDHADSIDAAQELQNQYKKQNAGGMGQVLIFGISESDNLNIMANAEVTAMTPRQGYNVILFNNALPVGAKLTMGIHEDLLDNATKYEQQQVDQIKDPDVKVVIFTSSFTDNLKIVTGSSTPAESFATLTNNQTSVTPSPPQTAGNQSAVLISPGTTTAQPAIVVSNPTGANAEKIGVNVTASAIVSKSLTNQTNTSTEKAIQNTTATATASKSVKIDEKVGSNTTTSK